uniref:AF4/FMR2 family, member 1 n=1 Tax=Gasterosteus aculeatus aculeatus TaxID=481459 RepID=A0AAQ4RM13_GASAC
MSHANRTAEERNRLRLRAWEQRNQETSQAPELASENVPLFGVPYKTNKGDELSNRIQRMLGSYEDVNNPYPFAIEPLPIPSCVSFSQSDQGPPNPDKPTKPPFHNQVHYMSAQTQKAPSGNGCSSQPLRTSAASSSPNHCGHSSSFNQLSLSAHQQKRSEVLSDLRECASLSHAISPQSPDAKPLPEMDASTFNLKQSPSDVSVLQANKGAALPSQTFPSLLLSKQPSVVMTQKPTAYVRPMDGQDQVVSESPELKSSPEPYVPLSELINKSDLCRTKILSPFLEVSILHLIYNVFLTLVHQRGCGSESRRAFPHTAKAVNQAFRLQLIWCDKSLHVLESSDTTCLVRVLKV